MNASQFVAQENPAPQHKPPTWLVLLTIARHLGVGIRRIGSAFVLTFPIMTLYPFWGHHL